ncbi:uncharacterized protein BJ212DRAFT_1481515 [Suillus subaureus]|uniref:F-box domain-containing protein n=1 Tax=Suillus subaureus TaxID=48587 RepID=A0A9P7EA57_9AGAM|nr:uncharacterized protein BJ212DRAFT_1481515 [Suillus subaureus]KAG1815759.1 hypothetical protein BJ212DRAFT_1481515 [Suillus subaureus]
MSPRTRIIVTRIKAGLHAADQNMLTMEGSRCRNAQFVMQVVDHVDWHWQLEAFCYDSWLKRSRGRPLSLALGRYPSTNLLRSFLQPYINQPNRVSLPIFFPRRNPTQLEISLENLPALQELVIAGMSLYRAAFVRSISTLLSTMRGLKILDVSPPFELEHINPACGYLINVEITIYLANGVLLLLQLCPNLSSITIDVTSEPKNPLEPLRTVTGIRTLCITDTYYTTHPDSLSDLFNALSLSNLHVLEALSGANAVPHQLLVAFLARSKCPWRA